MPAAELLVQFGCGIETDDPEQGLPYWSSRWDRPRPVLKWKGVEEGVPRLLDAVERVTDSCGGFGMTFFVRADEQIRTVTGSSAFIHERFGRLFNGLDPDRFEFGWHPHLYRWSDRLRSWSTELEDDAWLESEMKRTFGELERAGRRPHVARCDGVTSPVYTRTLDSLGLEADSSAFPGHRIMAWNSLRNRILRGIALNVCFDWIGSPDQPYRPAADDHRRPGTLSLWEVPLDAYSTRHPLFPWQTYYTPWKFFSRHPGQTAYLEGLFRTVKETGRSRLLVTSQHSSDIVRGWTGRLFRHSIDHLAYHIETLQGFSDRFGIPFRFVTFRDILSRLQAENASR